MPQLLVTSATSFRNVGQLWLPCSDLRTIPLFHGSADGDFPSVNLSIARDDSAPALREIPRALFSDQGNMAFK